MDQRQEQKPNQNKQTKKVCLEVAFSLCGILTEQSQICSFSGSKWVSVTVRDLALELDWPEFESQHHQPLTGWIWGMFPLSSYSRISEMGGGVIKLWTWPSLQALRNSFQYILLSSLSTFPLWLFPGSWRLWTAAHIREKIMANLDSDELFSGIFDKLVTLFIRFKNKSRFRFNAL